MTTTALLLALPAVDEDGDAKGEEEEDELGVDDDDDDDDDDDNDDDDGDEGDVVDITAVTDVNILFQLIFTRLRGGPIGGVCCVASARYASFSRWGWVATIFFHPIVSTTSVA